jgi:uncharacterized membrane-anchored protein
MTPMRRWIVAGWCLLALAVVNVSVAMKERLLGEGRIVYLQLAPVDPRSLMAGDYMALRFAVANQALPLLEREEPSDKRRFNAALRAVDGQLVVALDERAVGTFRRIDNGSPLAADEVRLRYRVRNGTLKFATNAFFFQEGHAGRYQAARYGQFRVAPDGDLLLTALCDTTLEVLGAAPITRSSR